MWAPVSVLKPQKGSKDGNVCVRYEYGIEAAKIRDEIRVEGEATFNVVSEQAW